MRKAIDIVKPKAETYLDEYNRFMNWQIVQLRKMLAKDKPIPVSVDNEQDYEFVFIDHGNGVKKMAVF